LKSNYPGRQFFNAIAIAPIAAIGSAHQFMAQLDGETTK